MNENKVTPDRGDKTKEELLEEMSPEAVNLVDNLTTNIVKRNKRETGHFNKRNRTVWNRMNRPLKLEAIDRGMAKVYKFFEKVTKVTKVPEETVETKTTEASGT